MNNKSNQGPKDVFQFTVSFPRERFFEKDTAQFFTIRAKMPMFQWINILDRYDDKHDKLQFELAKAELKLAMIEALMNGEWTHEGARP